MSPKSEINFDGDLEILILIKVIFVISPIFSPTPKPLTPPSKSQSISIPHTFRLRKKNSFRGRRPPLKLLNSMLLHSPSGKSVASMLFFSPITIVLLPKESPLFTPNKSLR